MMLSSKYSYTSIKIHLHSIERLLIKVVNRLGLDEAVIRDYRGACLKILKGDIDALIDLGRIYELIIKSVGNFLIGINDDCCRNCRVKRCVDSINSKLKGVKEIYGMNAAEFKYIVNLAYHYIYSLRNIVAHELIYKKEDRDIDLSLAIAILLFQLFLDRLLRLKIQFINNDVDVHPNEIAIQFIYGDVSRIVLKLLESNDRKLRSPNESALLKIIISESLSRDTRYIPRKVIAARAKEELGLSESSITRIIKRLSKRKMIKYNKEKKIIFVPERTITLALGNTQYVNGGQE